MAFAVAINCLAGAKPGGGLRAGAGQYQRSHGEGLKPAKPEFMAGDRALRSSREVPQAWLEEAQKRGLKVGKQLTFATMTFAGDTPQLANVKAVDDIYPMYGDLQTNPLA